MRRQPQATTGRVLIIAIATLVAHVLLAQLLASDTADTRRVSGSELELPDSLAEGAVGVRGAAAATAGPYESSEAYTRMGKLPEVRSYCRSDARDTPGLDLVVSDVAASTLPIDDATGRIAWTVPERGPEAGVLQELVAPVLVRESDLPAHEVTEMNSKIAAVAILDDEMWLLARVIRQLQAGRPAGVPLVGCETGMAGGVSAASIVAGAVASGFGSQLYHFSVDPYQEARYSQRGAELARRARDAVAAAVANTDAGAGKVHLEHVEVSSSLGLAAYQHQMGCLDFAFIDDGHTYEIVMSELRVVHEMLKVGGVIILQDTWMAPVLTAAHFMESALHYRRVVRTSEDKFGSCRFLIKTEASVGLMWFNWETFRVEQGEAAKMGAATGLSSCET